MIDQPTVERILDTAQIVDVVSDFVTLKKRGVNYVGLCPFHDDKTPSMYVSPAKGIFKCFACGKAGNAAGFVMEHEQMSWPDALRYLANKYNIQIQERELSDEERQSQSEREGLFAINQFACDYFKRQLHESEEGRSIGLTYFRGRGFRDDIIEKFQLGYALERRDALASEALKNGYKKEGLVKTGLCFETDDHRLRDRFWGRVIFPFHTLSGKVVAFGGRVLSRETKGVAQKYVNSPESEIFTKGNNLYGLYFAKQAIMKKDRCFLVEGYTDVISMHQSGIENVVASSGTALTEAQIRLIHRFTSNITVLYDGDEAGIHAALRGTDLLLAEGMNVKVCLLPDGDDPDSFARKHNATEYQEFIEQNETDFIRFKTKLLMRDAERDPIKRAELIGSLMESISVIPEAIVRDIYIKECAQMLQIDDKILVSEVAKRREKHADDEAKRKERERNRAQNTPPADTPHVQNEETVPPPPPEDWDASESSKPQPTVSDKAAQEFESYERMLAETIVRYGGRVMCEKDKDKVDEGEAVSVIAYISHELRKDDLKFHSPVYQLILEEAELHKDEAGFNSEHFFINHTNPDISRMSVNLVSNRYQLSKYHYKNQTVVNDEDRLLELVPILVTNFKYAEVTARLKYLSRQLQDPEIAKDDQQCNAIMTEYSSLMEVKNMMAKNLGERVVLSL
ncbi:MAG: DNA primase [Bacteroidaceae bacterium]|nr:DNA primase [Bacteroidaceae bacterium]